MINTRYIYSKTRTEDVRSGEEAMLRTDTRQANWRRANPAKYDAHLAVQRAIKAGELEKQTCEVCGGEAAMPITINTTSR